MSFQELSSSQFLYNIGFILYEMALASIIFEPDQICHFGGHGSAYIDPWCSHKRTDELYESANRKRIAFKLLCIYRYYIYLVYGYRTHNHNI